MVPIFLPFSRGGTWLRGRGKGPALLVVGLAQPTTPARPDNAYCLCFVSEKAALGFARVLRVKAYFAFALRRRSFPPSWTIALVSQMRDTMASALSDSRWRDMRRWSDCRSYCDV